MDIICRRKWVLVLPIAGGLVVGIILSLTLQPLYRSTTLILVEQQQVPEAYVMPTDRTPFSDKLNTIKQQILSRTKLEQIISEFGLYKDEDSSKTRNPIKKVLIPVTAAFSGKQAKEDLIDRLRNDIDIKVIGESKRGGDAFSVNFIGKNPKTAMQVTNTLASFFIDENLKAREEYAEGTSEFLSNELERARLELETQERSLRKFREYYMGGLPEQLDTNLRTLDRLQIELQSINTAIKTIEERKNFFEDQLGLAAVGKSTISVNPLVVELERLKAELSALLSVYKDTYPDVAITRKRIAEIEDQFSARSEQLNKGEKGNAADASSMGVDISGELTKLRAQLASLKQRESEIRGQITALEKRVEQTPANEQRLTNIRRDYDISLKNYQALLEKKLSARLAENMEKRQKGERFRILDPANLPEKPYKPDKARIVFAGLAVGGAIGAMLAYLLEFLNPAFRKADELTDAFEYPVLAVIPEFMPYSGRRAEKRLKLVKG